MIFNMSGGGGGAGFAELTIVGGTFRPAKATQNMIWINTDVEITAYALAATTPEEPYDGMVWIGIDDSSKNNITAPVSDSWITICPLFVQQYIGGAWTDKVAKSYQDGTWVDWFVLLYNYGDVCAGVTSGWAKKNRSSSSTASGSMTLNEDNIYIKNVSNGSTGAATVAQIDLTDYSEIHCICQASKCNIGVAPEFPASSYVASGTYEDTTVGDAIVLDIREVEGMMRICISEGSITGMYIYKVWLT